MIPFRTTLLLVVLLCIACSETPSPPAVFNTLGEMAGEVTHNSIILQSRITASDSLEQNDIPGAKGVARFEWSEYEDFSRPKTTPWIKARHQNDFVIKTKLVGLSPGKNHFYRLVYGHDTLTTYKGPIRKFRTLPGKQSEKALDFIVTSCFNYHRFHFGTLNKPNSEYKGEDKAMGYPGLEIVTSLNPDFVVFTGDNVYYDTPQTDSLRAKTRTQLRQKWYEQFAQSRFRELFSQTATYWEKDDHDHRFNDSDTLTDFSPSSRLKNKYRADSIAYTQPSHQLGVEIFREQVPVVDPTDSGAVTYRTHRMNKHLQIWFT